MTTRNNSLKETEIILIISTVIIALIIISFLSPIKFKNNSDIRNTFQKNKKQFEKLAEYSENYYNERNQFKEVSLSIFYDELSNTNSFYDGNYIKLEPEISNAINKVKILFKYDFSSIIISQDRISFVGQGNERYVYLRKGGIPYYFFDKNSNDRFTCSSLGNGWFYLYLNVR